MIKRLFIGGAVVIGLLSALMTAHVSSVSAQAGSGASNITVEQSAGQSIAEGLLDRLAATWPWYVTRASGLVAALALVLLMLSGTGFITGRTFAFLEPITAWATHRALGIVLGVSVLIHVAALYFDTFVPFGLKDLLVPFASSYRPLYVTLGIIALYVLLAIVLTSLFWINKKPKTWKIAHLLSYVAMALVFVHALYLGTDISSGILRIVWVMLGVLVLAA